MSTDTKKPTSRVGESGARGWSRTNVSCLRNKSNTVIRLGRNGAPYWNRTNVPALPMRSNSHYTKGADCYGWRARTTDSGIYTSPAMLPLHQTVRKLMRISRGPTGRFVVPIWGVPPSQVYRILVNLVTTFATLIVWNRTISFRPSWPLCIHYTTINVTTFFSSQTGRSVGI